MNVYKEIEKINDFQLQQLKKILDELPLFEIVEKTDSKLIVRQEAKNCISMKDLLRNWEMIREEDGLIVFRKISDAERTYEDRIYES